MRVDAEDARRPAADRAPERQRVLRHHRVAADEPVPADAAELVHRRPGADVRVVLDRDVPAERRVRPEDGVAADVAVVRDVHVRHEQVVVADGRLRRRRPAVPRLMVDELAEDVAAADRQPRRARPCISGPAAPARSTPSGRCCVSSPISVQPSMTADAPMRQRCADA